MVFYHKNNIMLMAMIDGDLHDAKRCRCAMCEAVMCEAAASLKQNEAAGGTKRRGR